MGEVDKEYLRTRMKVFTQLVLAYLCIIYITLALIQFKSGEGESSNTINVEAEKGIPYIVDILESYATGELHIVEYNEQEALLWVSTSVYKDSVASISKKLVSVSKYCKDRGILCFLTDSNSTKSINLVQGTFITEQEGEAWLRGIVEMDLRGTVAINYTPEYTVQNSELISKEVVKNTTTFYDDYKVKELITLEYVHRWEEVRRLLRRDESLGYFNITIKIQETQQLQDIVTMLENRIEKGYDETLFGSIKITNVSLNVQGGGLPVEVLNTKEDIGAFITKYKIKETTDEY